MALPGACIVDPKDEGFLYALKEWLWVYDSVLAVVGARAVTFDTNDIIQHALYLDN